jgi:hypothetical protein
MIGRLLLIAFAASLLLGLSAGVWARRRGKPFVDWWFLGSGLSFAVLVVLYLFGLFNNITFL